ncbi:MAG: hypothetical protein AAGB31_15840, partial [Bdellovibrio sp.]
MSTDKPREFEIKYLIRSKTTGQLLAFDKPSPFCSDPEMIVIDIKALQSLQEQLKQRGGEIERLKKSLETIVNHYDNELGKDFPRFG